MSVIVEAKKYLASFKDGSKSRFEEDYWNSLKEYNPAYKYAKALIEYDQALREAQKIIHSHLYYSEGLKPHGKAEHEWIIKYSHLLKG